MVNIWNRRTGASYKVLKKTIQRNKMTKHYN